MKLLQVILPAGIGGAENIACMLHNSMNRRGNESRIAISSSYAEEFLKYFSIDEKQILLIDDDSWYKIVKSVRKIIRQYNPEIIHTHARRECVLVALLNRNAKHIRTQHMSEQPNIKVTILEKILLSFRVNCWVATSKTLVTSYFQRLNYININKVRIIYNGVEDQSDRFSYISCNTINKFCVVARLTRQKGIDILLDKLSQLDNNILMSIRIDIYGEGPELGNIIEQIERLKLNKVVFYMGEIVNPRAIFKNYSALLMPSRYEGLPLTMLEAMSCGLPVATHEVGCCKEFIETNENGWIINDEFTWNHFFRYLVCNPEKLQNISNCAREMYLKNFSSTIMCKNYEELYINQL